jgi:hypothetical protein
VIFGDDADGVAQDMAQDEEAEEEGDGDGEEEEEEEEDEDEGDGEEEEEEEDDEERDVIVIASSSTEPQPSDLEDEPLSLSLFDPYTDDTSKFSHLVAAFREHKCFHVGTNGTITKSDFLHLLSTEGAVAGSLIFSFQLFFFLEYLSFRNPCRCCRW